MSDFSVTTTDPTMTDAPDSLDDAALDWLVLLHSGTATAADRMAFQAWRGRSPAHAAAAEEALALWADLGQTEAAQPVVVPAASTARRAWWPALAASIVLATVGLLGWEQAPRLMADHSTSVGQIQTLTLADGTRVTLNSGSALSVNFSASERQVSLRRGEALFEPAPDGRPFVVQAGAERVQARAGRFSLRRAGSALIVVVAEGQAQVSGAHQSVLLQADQRLQLEEGQPLLAQQAVDAASLTAWQRGKLIFNGKPLHEVLGELERYQHGKILMSDEQLGALAVSGVFDLNDPQGLLRTLEQRYRLKVTYLPWLAVVY